jgi:hypothetical protein
VTFIIISINSFRIEGNQATSTDFTLNVNAVKIGTDFNDFNSIASNLSLLG